MTAPLPVDRGDRGPSATFRVFQALLDNPHDFMNVAQLAQATGANVNQVTAALFHLRKHQAADVVIEVDGTGWWFATPETDLRCRTVDIRKVEEPGHRVRKPGYARPRLVLKYKRSGEV